jgi:predicted glycogen debranching enzyme
MIHFKKDICRDFHNATQYEWIEANGIGGYASSTIIGANTRRYHGLLVAATHPPGGRVLLLSKVEETVTIDGNKYELSCNQYPNAIYPDGNLYLKEFRLTPFPKFIYEIKGVTIEKTVMMVHGSNTTIVSYNVFAGPQEVFLHIRPLVNFREYHGLTLYEEHLRCDCDIYEGAIKLSSHSNFPPLFLYHNAASFTEAKYYYKNMEYQEEAYRGFDCHEMLYNPGYFAYNVEDGDNCVFVASTDSYEEIDTMELMQAEISRRSRLLREVGLDNSALDPLIIAADTFVCDGPRKGTKVITAGYHWFGMWGRDALVALPGLTLATKRFEDARAVLSTMAMYASEGMMPNRLSEDRNDPEYNSVDASLWFFYAVHKYLEYTGDYAFVERELLSVLTGILHHYTVGTRFNIREEPDGLIAFANSDISITWMDVRVEGKPLIQRQGKVVEVNALWYNALKIMAAIAEKLNMGKEADLYNKRAEKTKRSFQKAFWNEEGGCLYDWVDGKQKDATFRPNQILAVSLPYSVLPKTLEKQILGKVDAELLTPFGLRTLSPGDSRYQGVYRGGVETRDNAYHQGSVWAWLIGAYVDAFVKVHGATPETRETCEKIFMCFIEHLRQAGLGTIAEIFDGNPPYHPRGCVSQAWSVGEVLRIYCEKLLGKRQESRQEESGGQQSTKRF